MTKLDEALQLRSNHKCELCQLTAPLKIYEVLPQSGNNTDNCILICDKCRAQIEKKATLDSQHWNCLKDAMWSEVSGIKVMCWRMLNRLKQESWAMDCLDMLYLDDDILTWAKATGDHEDDAPVDLHKDVNGQVLQNGDAITLIKSLDVKGSTMNAKMGTVVKNIRLVEDNTEQIEGKIEGQVIVILTKYVRKQH